MASPAKDNKPTTEKIGYQPEYSAFQQLRVHLRELLDTLLFEAVVIALVGLYAIIIFVDLTMANATDVDDAICIAAPKCQWRTNQTIIDACNTIEIRDWLYFVDLSFLSIFMVEIAVRIFAFDKQFFRDFVQVIDMVVVTVSFVIAVVPEDVLSSVDFLNILRVVRLFRLAVIINKLQRSREAAAMRSKRAMYKRLGAPVEKVLQFLTELRARQSAKRDQENIDWMMEVIASDELYAVAEFDENALLTMHANAQQQQAQGGATRHDSFSAEDVEEETGGQKKSTEKRKISSASLSLWAGAAIQGSNVSSRLQRLLSQETAWAFDIFEYDKACDSLPVDAGQGRSATLLCYFLLEQHGVLDSFEIERSKMLTWLTRIDMGYDKNNAYHNALHAADVCANVDYFLRQPNFNRLLNPIDILSALIAALMHDMGHPGLNNTFLEATKHELAVTYNDVSVLENHHVASAFKLLKNKDCDWTKALSADDYKDMRETVIQMVLGTDMRAHFEYLTKFKSKQAGEGFTGHLERKDMRLLLTMALHAADIANPAKREIVATTWAKRSMIEFFRQGDQEMELGIPVSPFMDRSKMPLSATIVNCQIGFINVLVRPLLSEWAGFLGDAAERDMVLTLDATLRLWETQGAKVIDSWGNFAVAPAAVDISVNAPGGKRNGPPVLKKDGTMQSSRQVNVQQHM